MRLSIVTTLYRSEAFIHEFVRRASQSARNLSEDYEIILVDDGSPDASLNVAKSLATEDDKLTVVELSRNFGHHPAILAGLEHASGDLVFLVDSDLEEAPELLVEFDEVMQKSDVDVVFGINTSAKIRPSSRLFWRFFQSATKHEMPRDICNVRLMKRGYVDALCSLPETSVFLGGLYHWVGFKQIGVPVVRTPRSGASTYSTIDRLALAVRSVVAFSTFPLKMIFWVGVTTAAAAALIALYYTVYRLVNPSVPMGFTSILVSLWFLGGSILAATGIIGIYISNIYTEAKGRPRTITRAVYKKGDTE